MAHSLIREKEKSPVPDDRTAKTAAEQIALERRRRTGSKVEEVAGVERIVAQKLEQFAVEFVGTGARRDIDDRAGILPVFGTEGRIIHLELLNTADGGLEIDRIKPQGVER